MEKHRLANSFSTGSFPNLPGMRTSPTRRVTNNGKLQRFQMTSLGTRVEAGPKEGNRTLDASLRNPLRNSDERLREIIDEKRDMLEKWDSLDNEESAINLSLSRSASTFQGSTISSNPLGNGRSTASLRLPPSWVSNDGEVLRFYVYFKEGVNESAYENFRVRKCTVYYFLSDGTIRMDEPKEENSGLLQGVFLKRGKLHKANGVEYKPSDFVNGSENLIHGRVFRTVDCDKKTSDYFVMTGVENRPAESYPDDPMTQHKAKMSVRHKLSSIAGGKAPDTLGKYLKNDRKVLRFRCVWNDTERLYGEMNEYILHYYLADDSIEIRNVFKEGRDKVPTLMSRRKLQRDLKDASAGYYTIDDLRCGEFITVCSRPLLMVSCDAFTKKYYERVHCIQQNDVKLRQEEVKATKQEMPPYNGFGGEEDSLANCLSLIPKPIHQDMHRFLKNRGKVLRFKARFADPSPEDAGRFFVISYFMDDETTSVYEPPQRNSGIVGGKFLEKKKYKIANEHEQEQDVASELQQMIYDKIQGTMGGGQFQLLRAFKKFQGADYDGFGFEDFKVGLRSVGLLPNAVSDEDMYALFQRYDESGDGKIEYSEFVQNVMMDKTVAVGGTSSARYLKPTDFYIGARMNIVFPRTGAKTQTFELIGADSRTINLMENDRDDFPLANQSVIISKLADMFTSRGYNVREAFRMIAGGKQSIAVDAFKAQLQTLLGDFGFEGGLTEHEAMTLARAFDRNRNGRVSHDEFCDALLNAAGTVSASDDPLFAKLEAVRGLNIRGDLAAMSGSADGSIDVHSFLEYFWNNNVELTDTEQASVVDQFGNAGSDTISYERFCDMLYGESVAEQKAGTNENKESMYAAPVKEPTLEEYRQNLLRTQHANDPTLALLQMMKEFSSRFFRNRHNMRKAFLSFDLDHSGKVSREEFEEAINRTNYDFAPKDRSRLLSYLFPQEGSELGYDAFMEIFFRQDVNAATSTYGLLPYEA